MKYLSLTTALCLILSLVSCDGSSDDSPPQIAEDIMEVAETVIGTIGLIFESEAEDPAAGTYPTGMSISWVEQDVTLRITLADCQPVISTDIVLSGTMTISMANDQAAGRSALTFLGEGMVILSGSDHSTTGIDATAVWPLVDGYPDTDEDPLETSGSLYVDNSSYDIGEILDQLDTEGKEDDQGVTNIRFLTVGNDHTILITDDGSRWEEVNMSAGTNQSLWDVAVNGAGTAVAAGDDGIVYYSDDYRTWTAASSGVSENIKSVGTAGNRFYLGTEGGTSVLMSADNGRTWTAQPLPGQTAIYAFAWDGTRLIAFGSNRTCSTTNLGATWTDLTDGNGPDFGSLTIRGAGYADGHWVATGISSDSPVVIHSVDGADWDTVDDAALTGLAGYMTGAASDGAGGWIVVGHSGSEYGHQAPAHVFRSTTGGASGWSSVRGVIDAPPVTVSHGAMGNGISYWMTVSNGGKAWFSTDGSSWTERSSNYGTYGSAYVPVTP